MTEQPLGGTPSTLVRRGRLLTYLRAHPGYDAYRISRECDAYKDLDAPAFADRCLDDLKALQRKGLVVREGRPAKWRVA